MVADSERQIRFSEVMTLCYLQYIEKHPRFRTYITIFIKYYTQYTKA